MSFQPKRPSAPSTPMTRPPPGALPSVRPVNVRDAQAEAHALGGGAIARPSSFVSAQLRKSVLLVDPDANLRARLRSLLEQDYDVVEASDGMEAVELTAKIQPPSMIVCETVMPRVDGFTFAKIMRNNPMMKRVPIMFVSAQHSPQHVTQALVIGVTQYLPKATPVSQIVEKIRKIVM